METFPGNVDRAGPLEPSPSCALCRGRETWLRQGHAQDQCREHRHTTGKRGIGTLHACPSLCTKYSQEKERQGRAQP